MAAVCRLSCRNDGQGGELAYRTNLRSADDPNYDGVATLLRGEDPLVGTTGIWMVVVLPTSITLPLPTGEVMQTAY
jgi:hypothetical protein